jgi:hypothetical protein
MRPVPRLFVHHSEIPSTGGLDPQVEAGPRSRRGEHDDVLDPLVTAFSAASR